MIGPQLPIVTERLIWDSVTPAETKSRQSHIYAKRLLDKYAGSGSIIVNTEPYLSSKGGVTTTVSNMVEFYIMPERE